MRADKIMVLYSFDPAVRPFERTSFLLAEIGPVDSQQLWAYFVIVDALRCDLRP